MTHVRVIGPGRAGSALLTALAACGGATSSLGRDDELRDAALGVDLLVIASTDTVIVYVAAAVTPRQFAVVAHLAGSLGLDVLGAHPRLGDLHPLVAL